MTKVHPAVKGSLVALVTPMRADGCIDFDQLQQLVEWHIEQQTDGIVVMGTTGESALVSDQEVIDVIDKVIQLVNGRVPVIAGCSGISTVKAIAMARKLEEYKPDALLCVTPYYIKPEQQGLLEHFNALADNTSTPLILYNVPSRTGVDLTNNSVVALAKHKNIVGIKDATGDLERIKVLSNQVPEGFALLSGDDESAFQYIAAGGNGVISVTANISPNKMSQWIKLASSGELSTSKQIFSELVPLHKVLFIESNPIPVKWALNLMGKVGTGYRKPLNEPSSESKQVIKQVLEDNSLV